MKKIVEAYEATLVDYGVILIGRLIVIRSTRSTMNIAMLVK